MKNKQAGWTLSLLLTVIMMAVMAGSAFAAVGDTLIHNSDNLGTKYGKWGVAGGKYGPFTCTTCHNKNTPNNIKRVDGTFTSGLGLWSSSKQTTVTVVFNSMTSFGNDAPAHTQSTAVCQVCHSKTTVHRYNKPVGQTDSNHKSANLTDCTTCHSHANAFKKSCNSCHGDPPNSTVPAIFGADGLVNDPANGRGPTGALPATQPGAHMAHKNIGMQCEVCHTGYDPTHSSDGRKTIDIGFRAKTPNWPQFGVFANTSVASGAYTGELNLTNGYTWRSTSTGTVINPPAAGASSCSVYCHGNWPNSNGAGSIPSWVNGSAEKACGACHGARPDGFTGDSATVPATNAHARHAVTLSTTTLGLTCEKCHGPHPDNTHISGSVKWDVSGLAAPNALAPTYKSAATGETGKLAPSAAGSFGTCSVYCHSTVQGTNGTGAPTSFAPVNWSAVSVNCDSCHWGQGGAFKLMSTGSHRAHVSRGYSYACTDCHSGAGSNTTLHADGKVQVSITAAVGGGTYLQAGKNAGAVAYSTCATTACHMSTTPTWGTPGSVAGNCLGCHGTEASSAANLSPLHNKHLNFPQYGGSFKCKDCHATVITNTDNRTLANKALHANSYTNYSGLMAGKATAATGSHVTCSTFYCHSNGKGVFVSMTGNKVWNIGTTSLGCNGCHGRSGTTGAPDNVANDSHVKHAPTAADCWKCHFKTASKTNPGELAAGTVDHLDKTLDARLAKPFSFANASGVYSGARNCSATYCHGTATTPQTWGQAGSTNCNSCHKSKWNGSVGLPGAHKFHVISTAANYNYSQAAANNSSQALGYNFNCAACHASGSGKATHVNGPQISATSGAAEVYFGYTSALKNGTGSYVYATAQGTTDNGFTYTNGAGCNTTYCHSNGQAVSGSGSNGLTNPDWSITTGAGTCAQCHGNEGNAGTLSGAHNKHINGTSGGAYKCKDCHATTITNADNRTLANKANHVNKMVNYSGQYAGKNKNCSNFYCHSYGTTLSGPFTVKSAPVWTGSVNCYSCHGGDSTTGLFNNMSTGRHKKHMVGQYSYGCAVCHASTVSNNTTISTASNHVNQKINVRFSGVAKNGNANAFYTFSTHATGVTGTVNDTCSNVYCHSNAQTGGQVGTTYRFRNLTGVKRFNQTTTVSLGCSNCHTSSSTTGGAWALSGEHLNHVSLTINPQIGKALACNDCHANGGTNLNRANHANGIINYSSALGGSSARGNLKLSTGRCSNIYCHSNGQTGAQAVYNNMSTVAWFSGVKFGCNGCHGNAASAASLSGVHNAHINGGAATGGMFNCKDCHASTLNISFGSNTTLNASGNHVNAYRNFSGAKAYKTGYNDVAGTCSTYCHTNGKGAAPAVAVNWAGPAIDCSGCHANGTIATGAHQSHLSHVGITCANCHNSTTNNGTTITGATHIDGSVNLLQGGTFNGAVTFTPSSPGCNNISCHGGASAPDWNGQLSCDGCHPKSGLSGAHRTHMGSLDLTNASIYYNMTANRSMAITDTDTTYGQAKTHGFGCANCHPMNLANHINGSVDVDMASKNVAGTGLLRFLNSTTAGKLPLTYSFVNKQCNNIYCHSNASRVVAELVYKQTPAWTGAFSGDRCAGCHDNQPSTGAHQAHSVGNHTNNSATVGNILPPAIMYDGNIYNGKSGKVLISNRPNSNTAHGNPNNSTTISCNICHQGTVTSAKNDQNTKCYYCHVSGNYGATPKGNAAIANLKNHVDGTREIQFAQVFVKSKAQVRNESFKFYSGVWQRNTYKNMSTLSYDTAKVRLDLGTTYTYGTPMNSSCSNVVCHNGKSPKWNLADWNDPNKCMDCHNQL